MGVYYICNMVHHKVDDPTLRLGENKMVFVKLPWVKAGACVVLALLCLVLVATVQQQPVTSELEKANPQFIITGWDFLDEYGQGIESVSLWQNSTGTWGPVTGKQYYYESHAFDWEFVNASIKLRCYFLMNRTLTNTEGSETNAPMTNVQRHDISVTNFNGTILFSQQNFTHIASYPGTSYGYDSTVWYFVYDVVLNFLPNTYGEIYTATMNYEVWW